MEIIMLNIKVTYSKSKAKKGWKPWIVDARYALPGGTQKTFASKEEAERYIHKHLLRKTFRDKYEVNFYQTNY